MGPIPVIVKLDEAVVNKIAAGEVIQRPSSALKELLENSLDAGATQISVVVKEGGNKLLQIVDNGHGIRKADLPILCHRHTTSKLSSFEDLETISTLGFRGEALCSISFVSRMTVTTMPAEALHGYRAVYKDGELEPPGAKPVAAVKGTTISVEDLFYNVPTRRNALKSAAEEYARVVDIVSRYAVFRQGVAFTCKRQGEARADVSTLASASRLDSIRAVYGAGVAKELMPLSLQVGKALDQVQSVDDACSFTLEALISSANYAVKRSTFILFINDRAVECGPLRRALEATYAAVLPKACKPFLFLDLRLPSRHVEVNMHPTKREVGLLNQDEVVSAVRAAVEARLTASNSSHTFTQAALPFAPLPIQLPAYPQGTPPALPPSRSLTQHLSDPPPSPDPGSGPQPLSQQVGRTQPTQWQPALSQPAASAQAYRPDKLVRVDARTQSMEAFVVRQGSSGSQAGRWGGGGQGGGEGGEEQEDMQLDMVAAGERGEGLGLGEGEGAGQGEGADGRERQLPPPSRPPQAAAARAAIRGSIPRKRAAPGPASHPSLPLPIAQGANPLDLDPLDLDNYQLTGAGGGEGVGGEGGLPGGSAGGTSGASHRMELVRSGAPLGVTCELDSVRQLGSECEVVAHPGLQELLKGCVLVGMASEVQALLQYQTKLYLVDLASLSQDFFYQQVLRRFESVGRMRLQPPPPVRQLIAMALELEEAAGAWKADLHGPKDEVCDLVTALLREKSPMLKEYLGLAVDDQGHLLSVPLLLEGWEPDLARLPDLVLRLSRDVEWEEEGECFRALAQALAAFYSLQPLLPPAAGSGGGSGGQARGKGEAAQGQGVELEERERLVKTVLLPAMKALLRAPRGRASDGTFVQVAALERLYRIFERC